LTNLITYFEQLLQADIYWETLTEFLKKFTKSDLEAAESAGYIRLVWNTPCGNCGSKLNWLNKEEYNCIVAGKLISKECDNCGNTSEFTKLDVFGEVEINVSKFPEHSERRAKKKKTFLQI